ncbi:hypothetical protein J2W32_000325 [Variovorax boronicumulans]|uniref:DUF1799 domain-containing protein n=1 Tax=Variovorax boronicumulans TaxID=436515 RepID=A0AAW8CU07_9BURK|nr:DUF1799 domain-containing protein [Variovorax boronicumulans]MDP9891228.1 hypothetical protein [Variovorax boronicumulans]MDQ0051296.1 hypothetical protein [Variovorax boronicumulans]
MTAEDFAADPVEYWPDTEQAIALFCRVGTQWRVGGMGDLIGLDYAAVYPLMDRMQLSAAAWDALLDDIQVLESEALETRRQLQETEEPEEP